MSRNNETKLAGVQVVGYGHPTIYVIEDVNAGAVAIMTSGRPWQANNASSMSYRLEHCLANYLRGGMIRWAKGRPELRDGGLEMPVPAVKPAQEAYAKAADYFAGIGRNVPTLKPYTPKTPAVSAGFGQAVIDQALAQQTCPTQAKVDKLDERVKELTLNLAEVGATLVLTQRRLGELKLRFSDS